MVSSKEHKVESGGFNLEGSKFQYLYSEWVKKQVGIEDENVELKFYGQQSEPKLIIRFDLINNLDNNYEEIFKNTHNFYLSEIRIKHLNELNEQNGYETAQKYQIYYFEKIKELLGTPPFKFSYQIGLSNNEFSKKDFNIYYRCNYGDDNELKRLNW